MGERQETAQEFEMQPRPAANFHEVLGAGESATEHHQQHLGQREDDLPPLPRIPQRREVIEKGHANRQCHDHLRTDEGSDESHHSVTRESAKPVKRRFQAIALLRPAACLARAPRRASVMPRPMEPIE